MWTEGTHVGSVEDVATAKLGAFLRPDSSHIYEWTARDVREAVNHIIHICEGPVLAIRAWSPRAAI